MEHDAYEQINSSVDMDDEIRAAQKRFDHAQNSLESYMESKEAMEKARYKAVEDSKKRGFFDLSPDKSNLKGDNIIERLGYDKKAKENPKPNFLEKKIINKNTRMILYVVAIVAMLTLIILNHTIF